MNRILTVMLAMCMAVAFLAPAGAMAQLVRKAGPSRATAAKAGKSINTLCDKVNSAYRTKFRPGDIENGVPSALAYVVKTHFGGDTEAATDALSEMAAAASKFDSRWKQVTKRRKAVEDAVAKSKKLRRNEFNADAKDALISAITPVDRLDDGTFPDERDFLEIRDIELPLLPELGAILEDLHEWVTLFEVGAAMQARRKVYGPDEERLLWIASSTGGVAKFAEGNKPAVVEALGRVDEAVAEAADVGRLMAHGLWRKLNGTSLKVLQPADRDSAQVDDLVILRLRPDRISDETAYWYKDGSFDIDRDCYETNRIEGIDYRTGRFYYRVVCRKQHVTVNIRVNVEFEQAPESWARSGWVYIVGRVESKTAVNGVQWKIVDAVVPDTRYIEDL